MPIQANSGYHCIRQMATYDTITHVYMSIICEKDKFILKFAIWIPKKIHNSKNQLGKRIWKKSQKSNKNRPFCILFFVSFGPSILFGGGFLIKCKTFSRKLFFDLSLTLCSLFYIISTQIWGSHWCRPSPQQRTAY
jgi:hypothetical protein